MNRCPSCRSLVPAAWIACRRCGAALSPARPSAAVPRAGAITLQRSTLAAVHVTARPRLPPVRDTLLPRAERDSLLPLAARGNPRRLPLSRPIALTLAGALGALALVVMVVGGSHDGSSTARVAPSDPHARTVLLQVADAAQQTFVERGDFMSVTPGVLARRVRGVPLVNATTVARSGQASVRVIDANTFVAATPARDGMCMFARAEPAKHRIGYAATAGASCRAAAAPTQGWRGA